MTFFEKAKNKAEQLIGDAEEKVGKILGHEDLDENARKHDPWSGEVQEAGQDLPDDTAAGAVDDDTAAGAVDGDTDKLSDDDK